MKKTIKKGELVRTVDVTEDGKVLATFEIGGAYICNPMLDTLYADGWEDWIVPVPEPYVPTYAELVEQYIREHGYETYGAELAVINNYAADPTTYADEYAAYQAVRADAKEWANNQPHREY